MRQALRAKAPAPRGPVSIPVTIPPPVGGWNARDDLPSMAINDAIQLDNWVVESGGISARRGYQVHCSGLTGTFIETLMEFTAPGLANKLIAATPTHLYDVTVAGGPVAVLAGCTSGRWSSVMFSAGSGVDVLYAVNGADNSHYFNGTVWTASAFTGIATTELNFVTSHVNRLWFIEKNSSSLWYGPVGSISGALTEFPVQTQLRRGGHLVAAGSWSRDGGDGMDDFFVLVSSEGEVLIYQGSDPSSASTWSKVGLFRLAKPAGHGRILNKAGGDLSVLTSEGLVSLQQSLGVNVSGTQSAAVTNKIVNAFREVYASRKDNFGWQVQEYPRRGLLMVNVPIAERVRSYQFVANVTTGSWSRFTGIDALCWGILDDDLYFGGGDGKVYKFDIGSKDDTTPIIGIIRTSYSTYGSYQVKRWTQAQPIMTGPQFYSPQIYIRTDYDVSTGAVPVTSLVGGNVIAGWDVGEWDESEWALGNTPSLQWQSLIGYGVAGSVTFAVPLSEGMTYNGTQIVFEQGGVL